MQAILISILIVAYTKMHIINPGFLIVYISDHTAEDRSQPICKRLQGQL